MSTNVAGSTASADAATHEVRPIEGSSFNGFLPSPKEVREKSESTDLNAPPPVHFEQLGLVVKYGTLVKRQEYDAQLFAYRRLRSLGVPVPEVFGWTVNGGQGFLYMARIDGVTLSQRWKSLSEDEKTALCDQLKRMVDAWRSLQQSPEGGIYLGPVNKLLPFNDVILAHHKSESQPVLANPNEGQYDVVERFHEKLGLNLQGTRIVFTHGDLVPCNILVTRGNPPKIMAIIDWAQAGWYPEYWEWCKALHVHMYNQGMDRSEQTSWKRDYFLPKVMPEEATAKESNSRFEAWKEFDRLALRG